MNGFLRQSTAAQVRTIGPFVDSTDFLTLKNALTIANTDILIKKNGAASAAKNSGGATADGAGGLYAVTFDATDTATVGELSYSVKVAGALVVFGSYVVVEETVYDALYAASAPGYVVDQPVNLTKILGTAVSTPATAGILDVNAKNWNNLATVELPLVPTTAGRKLDVSAGGEAGVDWANVGSPTTTLALTGTTIAVTQKVDVDTIKTNPVVNAGTITFPTTATLASTTNITAGTVTTTTNLTNAPPDSSGVTTLLGKFTGITLLAQWLGLIAGKQTGNATARTELRATGAGSGTYDETTDSQEALRDNMGTAQTGDTFARLGAPAGASVSADVAAVKVDTAAILDDTGTSGVVVAAASKTGYALSTAGVQAIWDALTSVLTTVGSIGKLLVDNVNATISSRATPAQVNTEADTALADVGLTTTITGRIDAAVSTRATPAQVNTEVDTALADIHLDHLLAADYDPASKPGVATALLNELIESDAGVSRYTANALEQAPTGGSAPTAADVADAVWDEAIAGHLGAGSTGAALNAAGSAGDPWTTPLPGAYGAGTAGKIIGDNVNATISSRASQTSVDDVPTNAELATSQAAADDATLAAIAALNNLSMANVRTAVGLASANLDTQLADLPTNAELATALGTADDAVLAAIAALNDLSAADVASEISTAALATAANLALAKTAIDAIKAKTDPLTFTLTNFLQTDLKKINGTTVNGNGSSTPWGP